MDNILFRSLLNKYMRPRTFKLYGGTSPRLLERLRACRQAHDTEFSYSYGQY